MGNFKQQGQPRKRSVGIFSSLATSSLLNYIFNIVIIDNFCSKDTTTKEVTTEGITEIIMAESKILTAESVPQYITDHASDINIFPTGATLTAKAILGGNVNYAFYVTDETGESSVFLKQAPEFVAIFGPDGLPLTSERMKREMDVYDEWKAILGEELRGKYLPNIYKFDCKLKRFLLNFNNCIY